MTRCALCQGLIEPLAEGLNQCPHCEAVAVVVTIAEPAMLLVLEEEDV